MNALNSKSQEPVDSIQIKILGRDIVFQYPNSPYMKNVVMGILKGKDYPIFGLSDFSPDVILDIGANVGATAIYFHSVYPKARILCYEPSPRNYDFLEANAGFFDNIHTFPYGLFNKECILPIYLGKDQSAQDSVVNNNETTDRTATARLVKASDEIAKKHIERISILKIDTEGCEVPILGEILPGPDSPIAIDLIYLEYHSEEDRLELDRMLADRFLLLYARVDRPHRGSYAYISKNMARAYPGLEKLRITLSDDKGHQA